MQLSEIEKPVVDPEGFFASFIDFIDHMVDAKFLPPAHRQSTSLDADPASQLRTSRRPRLL